MDHDNYNDNDYEEFLPKAHGRVYRVFRAIALTLTALFCVFLAARIHINNTVPRDARIILWDESAYDAYQEDPEGFALVSHPLGSYTDPDTGKNVIRNTMTADAYFSFSDVCYAPDSGQIQLTVRYNESTVGHLMEDYELSFLPEGELFRFVLEDAQGNRYYDYYFTAYAQKFLGKSRYQYRRLLFRGVDLNTDTLTLKIYYIGQPIDSEQDDCMDEIIVYDRGFERVAGVKAKKFDPPAGVSEMTESPFIDGENA